MRVSKLIGITIVVCAAVVVATHASAGNTNQSPETRMLETKIIQLEQRLYSIEATLNRLQQSAYSQRSAPTASTIDPEIRMLREQLQNVTLRLSETECGLLKLDERTATSRRGTPTTDPCRANANAPLRLPSRP